MYILFNKINMYLHMLHAASCLSVLQIAGESNAVSAHERHAPHTCLKALTTHHLLKVAHS